MHYVVANSLETCKNNCFALQILTGSLKKSEKKGKKERILTLS